MALKILLALLCAGVMLITPFYVKAQKNGACKKSLALKMAAATGYIAAGVLCALISGELSAFDRLIFCALGCSWIGDLFLHLWQKKIYTAIGFTGFLSAHFFFIAAYMNAIGRMLPERSFFSVQELLFVLTFDIFFVIFALKTGIKLKGIIALPILLYATVITTMLCKAVLLGAGAVTTGAANAAAVCVFAVCGAALFVASDFSISILMFNPRQKKNYPLKMFNMLTYFAAQLLLACLIIFNL